MKWNREKTRELLRYGRKNGGPWDMDDDINYIEGDLPDDSEVDLVVAAPELLRNGCELEELVQSSLEYLPPLTTQAIVKAMREWREVAGPLTHFLRTPPPPGPGELFLKDFAEVLQKHNVSVEIQTSVEVEFRKPVTVYYPTEFVGEGFSFTLDEGGAETLNNLRDHR